MVAAVRDLLGLSRAELAGWLGVSMDAVRSWEVGRRGAPSWVFVELRVLQDAMDSQVADAVASMLQSSADAQPPTLRIHRGANAQGGGHPPVGWQLRVAARAAQQVPRLRIAFVDATSDDDPDPSGSDPYTPPPNSKA